MSDQHGEHGAHAPNSVSPEWSRRILGAFFAGCLILLVVDFVYHRHEYHSWERLKAFYPLYGFFGISALIVISKGLRRLVMRPEDYYDVPVLGEDLGDADEEQGGGHAE
ncbi:MAG: hypothetical protein ACR2QM_11095 [Longimicrobiales bacterium]